MFAVRRTASVPGPIRLLNVSMITMKGVSMVGVRIYGWFVFLIHPNNINLTHNGKTSVSVSVRCLVLVKM